MPLVKAVDVKITATGYEDAKLKIDKLTVASEELAAEHPEIKPQIDAQKALLSAKLLREGIKKELSREVMTPEIDPGPALAEAGALREGVKKELSGAGGADSLSGLMTPIAGLVVAGVALSPILVTLATGLAGFGLAAAADIEPIMKAAQATGGLAANMSKLTPVQRGIATSILGLGADFRKFSQSMQPQVLKVFSDGLKIAADTLKAIQPVAKATGTALDGALQSVDNEFKSNTWKQFFTWMAANVGPDIQQVTSVLMNLAATMPRVLESLQPVASEFLTLLQIGTKISAVMATVGSSSQQAGQSSASGWQKAGNVINDVGKNIETFGAPAVMSLWKNITGAGNAADTASGKAQKAGSSIKSVGAAAQTSAQQVTALYNALHKLLDPLTQNIQDAVTFKDDQIALEQALKKSHDALGLHTAAQRASSSAAAQAAQDALTLSQNILTQTGSASKAARPLQALANEMRDAGAKGGAAAALLRELEAAIAALHSKTIDVTVITRSSELPQGTVGSPPHKAAGGWASGMTLVGERGPELVSLPTGSYVHSNAQSQQMMGATYNINVGVLPGNEREAGRVIVQAIRKFEQGSGSSWRN